MNLTGTVLGHGIAQSPSRSVFYTIVEPDRNLQNLTILGREGARWHSVAVGYAKQMPQTLPFVVAQRANFADQVFGLAAENTRVNVQPPILVSQAEEGRVLGVMIYGMKEEKGYIGNLAIDPSNLTGSLGNEQLRGVGTGLVAAASRKLLQQGVIEITLHPFDDTAREFWAKRGLVKCGGGTLCARSRQAMESLIGSCVALPDIPGRDFIFCGIPKPPTKR